MKKNLFIVTSVILASLFAYAAYVGTSQNASRTAEQYQSGFSDLNQNTATENNPKTTPIASNSKHKNMNTVKLETTEGTIVLELSSDKPNTTENFKKLVSSGYYDGVKFHRVIKGFMIQSGDPTSKDDTKKDFWGTGGPGYDFDDELTGNEKYPQGTLAMANRGPNTNGSQFFIVTAQNAPLPPSYTVFGKVVSGMDVALKIESTPTDGADRPITDITIKKATLN